MSQVRPFLKMRSFWRSCACLVGALCLWGGIPEPAAAQNLWAFPSEGILNTVLEYFYQLSGQINDRISFWARAIFVLCATLEAVLLFWNIILEEMNRRSYSSGGIRGLLWQITTFIIFVSLGGTILANDGYITNEIEEGLVRNIAPWVVNGACFSTTSGKTSPLSPSEVVKVGWWIQDRSYNNMMLAVGGGAFSDSTKSGLKSKTNETWYLPKSVVSAIDTFTGSVEWILNMLSNPSLLITYFSALLIIPTFYVIAFQIIITEITVAMLGAFMPLFLAFLPLSFASPVIDGYIRYYLYTVFKLFFIYILLVPSILLPGMVVASTSTKSLSATNPISGCENALTTGPGGFSVPNIKSKAPGKITRMDLSITLAVLGLVAAAILKTIPERIARQVTSRFTIQPLYDIYD